MGEEVGRDGICGPCEFWSGPTGTDRQAPKILNSAGNVGQRGGRRFARGEFVGSITGEEVRGDGIYGPCEFWSGPIGTDREAPKISNTADPWGVRARWSGRGPIGMGIARRAGWMRVVGMGAKHTLPVELVACTQPRSSCGWWRAQAGARAARRRCVRWGILAVHIVAIGGHQTGVVGTLCFLFRTVRASGRAAEHGTLKTGKLPRSAGRVECFSTGFCLAESSAHSRTGGGSSASPALPPFNHVQHKRFRGTLPTFIPRKL